MKSERTYQSGQRVTINGWYEVAGAPKVQFTLHPGDVFPDYDGCSVSWRLRKVELDFPEEAKDIRRKMKPVSANLYARLHQVDRH
jgi:hypothetical protein